MLKKFILVSCVVAAPSYAEEVTSTLKASESVGRFSAAYGIKRVSFAAAPIRQDLMLDQVNLSYTSPEVFSLQQTSFKGQLTGVYSDLRGNVGNGLKTMSGLAVTPSLVLEHSFSSVTPYLRAGYTWGEWRGRGSEEWTSESTASLVLTRGDSLQSQRKTYRYNGAEVGAGVSYAVQRSLSLNIGYDLAWLKVSNSNRVYQDGREVDVGSRTFSRAHTFTAGAGYQL